MSSRSTRLLVLLGVVLVAAVGIAVAVAALGDGRKTATKVEYETTVTKARDRVDFALVRITKSQSVDDLIVRIEGASTAVDGARRDLDDAGVAEGFEGLHDRLVDTFGAFSEELANTAAQFEDPTFAPNLQGISSLGFLEWENVNKILGEMKERGLDVALLERH